MKTRTKLYLSVAPLLLLVVLLSIVELDYIKRTQFVCLNKIENNEELTKYELFAAKLTHTNLWLFGWIYDPNTAHLCFCKQFHINPFLDFKIDNDEYLNKCISQINRTDKTKRLTWKTYTNPTSVYLNGSIKRYEKDVSEIQYYIVADYKPGTIKIAGITICETIFDYLENIGILDTFAFFRTDAFIHRGVIRGQEMYQIERNLLKKHIR